MFALSVTSLGRQAPTFDEQSYIVRGLGYLRGENRHMRVGHPLGLNALNAALLVQDPTVRLPIDDPSWNGTSFHRPAELFLWEIGNDVAHIMFLARLPTIWLALLMAALTGRWARELSRRRWPGVLALALVALDPNILAHSQLTTTDLGLAAGALLATFTLWRFLRRPAWGRAVLAGAAFGLLQNTKFTAGLFVPLLALVMAVALFRAWRRRRLLGLTGYRALPWSLLRQLVLAYPLAAFLTLWAGYGLEIGTLPADLPTLPQLSGYTLPLAHHLEQLLDIGGRVQHGANAFLLGRYSSTGWWYYFPVAFALKTPVAILALYLVAGAAAIWIHLRRQAPGWLDGFNLAALLIPSLGYMAFALTSEINLGYRHLLVMLPLLAVFTAAVMAALVEERARAWRRPLAALAGILALWLAIVSLAQWPHYLAYFNVLAGGPANGWRFLVDSNLDWGQDLAGLADWMDANQVDHVWLSYFGEARPAYYGIEYTGLASYPPRLMHPDTRPFFPSDPAPGWYAISATNLQGALFQNHDLLGWFREREPDARIGYSIFLYHVPRRGSAAALALGGLQPDELDPRLQAELPGNDIAVSWFDPEEALLIPGQSSAWVALNGSRPLAPALQPWADRIFTPVATASGARLFRVTATGRANLQAGLDGLVRPLDVAFRLDEGEIRLRHILVPASPLAAGGTLTLLTAWRQGATPRPVKLFVHLLDSAGEIQAQWDGLGGAWPGWRDGDLLLQTHQLDVPLTTPAGDYRLVAGVYDPATLQRWPTPAGVDSIDLATVVIP